jgi:hypothetical protein
MGLAISPSIMIGFIIEAGKNLQPRLMSVLSSIMPSGLSMQGKGGGSAFSALQNADVTTIVKLLKNAVGTMVPSQVKPMVFSSIDSLSDKITTTFQSTLNNGYTHMYVAATIIAALGLIFTLLLKNKKDLA